MFTEIAFVPVKAAHEHDDEIDPWSKECNKRECRKK